MHALRSIAGVCSVALVVNGCATASKDLTATYVSPLQYQAYDCDQLAAEIQRISGRVNQLGGRLDEAANNDKGIMAVGLILFWPALFALGGTKQQEAEYSRLKGEYDAIEQQAIIKKCPFASAVSTTASNAAAPTSASTGSNQTVASTSPANVVQTPKFSANSVSSTEPPTSVAAAPPPAAIRVSDTAQRLDPPATPMPTAAAAAVSPPPAPAAPTIMQVSDTLPAAASPNHAIAAPAQLPVTAAPALTPAVAQVNGASPPVVSKRMFNAERLAKAAGCDAPVATVNISVPTYETFTVRCSNIDPMSIRCDDSACRELR